MAVSHLAGALASFLIGGYLLIDSIFAMGLGNVGILYCLNHYDWCQSHNLTGTILAKFGAGDFTPGGSVAYVTVFGSATDSSSASANSTCSSSVIPE